MSLEVYPADFSTRYEISHAISVMLPVYYNTVGKATIVLPVNDYNINMLKNGAVVYDTTRGTVYYIVNVKTDTKLSRLTANCVTADERLNRRTITTEATVTNVEADCYTIITNNLRGLQMGLAPLKGLEETASDTELYGGQLMDTLQPVLEEAGLGRRVLWDDATKTFTFEIYKGEDRTQGIHSVTFSEEQGTAQELIINDDVSSLKNVAYIVVEYSDDTTELISVGTAEGEDRREVWSKSTVRQSSDESREEVVKRAKSEAALELARNIARKNFSVVIDPEELGQLYNLGDMVACVSVRFGIQFTARVTGVKYTMDITGEKTEVILGTPNLTAIGGLKLG